MSLTDTNEIYTGVINLFSQDRDASSASIANAIYNIKFGGNTLPRQVLQSMWAFISIFAALFIFFTIGLLALGNDLITSFGAITASLANAGAGLGKVSSSFATLNIPSKWLIMFAMLLGRLEIFSLLVLFTPSFWQK